MPKKRKSKKKIDLHMISISIMIVLVGLTFIFIFSSSLYAIYYARVIDPFNRLLTNQIILQNELVRLEVQTDRIEAEAKEEKVKEKMQIISKKIVVPSVQWDVQNLITYTNINKDFELKYPAGWVMQEPVNEPGFDNTWRLQNYDRNKWPFDRVPPEGSVIISINILKKTRPFDIDKALNCDLPISLPGEEKMLECTKTEINGIEFKKKAVNNWFGYEAFMVTVANEQKYDISIRIYGKDYQDRLEIAENIFKTLKIKK